MPKFNVILFCDTPTPATKTRGYGTHRLASHLRERGYTCLVVDFSCIINWKLYNEILESTMGEETYMVGFSTTFMPMRIPMTEVTDSAQRQQQKISIGPGSIYTDCLITNFSRGTPERWLTRIKEINPNTKVVLGGTGVGFYVDFKNVDNFIFGLSETMAIDYLDSVSGRGKRRLFSRVLDYDYKAQAPVWDFRKSTTTYTEYDFITPNETLSLEIGRGCRFKCTYCSFPLIGQKNIDDYLKFKKVLRQELMENYERWGTTQYYIMDDTFNDSTEKLLMVKEVFDSLPFKVKFWCYLRLDLLALHPEQIPLLKELGLNQTYFGIETFHPKAGKSIGKGMSAEKRKIALDKCKEIWGDDVHIQAGFMVGLPHEPEDSIIETAAYLRDPNCPIHEPWIFPLTVFNGQYKDSSVAWVYKSEFDKNFDKHGYYFDQPVTIENVTNWKKDDGTDIFNFDQAVAIAGRWASTVPKRLYTADFYKSSLDHPILKDRDLTKKMTHVEYESFVKSLDLEDIFYTTITTQYFEPLLKKLKSKDLFINRLS